MMDMNITFGGNKKIIAEYKGMQIPTDQPENSGGEGSAPEPFSLFLASIGTCAGFYVKSFCDKRELDPEGIKITQSMNFDAEKRLVNEIEIDIDLPEGFPQKYHKALLKAVDSCTVKKHLADPPKIKTVINS